MGRHDWDKMRAQALGKLEQQRRMQESHPLTEQERLERMVGEQGISGYYALKLFLEQGTHEEKRKRHYFTFPEEADIRDHMRTLQVNVTNVPYAPKEPDELARIRVDARKFLRALDRHDALKETAQFLAAHFGIDLSEQRRGRGDN
jgi:hypothetical protein